MSEIEFPHGFIIELWEKAGFLVKKSGSCWVSPECPRCGRARTGHRVSLDPEKNVWKCFGEGCGAQGGVKDFCEEIGWDFREILESAGLWEDKKSNKKEKNSMKDRSMKDREIQKNEENQISLTSLLTKELPVSAKEYLQSRGIEPDLVKEYVLGIKTSNNYGKWLWEKGYRFFVPQYRPKEDGWEIVSGRFRLVEPVDGEAKSRSPKGKPNSLFREKTLAKADVGIIFEGEIDFLSALVLMQKRPDLLSQYNFFAVPSANYTFRDEEIRDLPREVVIFLDRGAEKNAERLARQLYVQGKKVYLGKYPEPYKDLNEWLQSEGVDKTAQGLVEAIGKAWWEGAYTPLRGIVREVEDFIMELEKVVEERERFGELEFRAKVYPTGIKELDEILSGGFRPALYGLAGAPGSGKTSFVLALIRRIIERNNAYVLFASLEMPVQQIIAYLLSWGARISWLKILNMELDKNGLEKVKESKQKFQKLFESISVLSSPLRVEDIRRKLVEYKNMALDEERPFFVVVDYLQMLKLEGTDIRLGITDAVRRLADIANHFEVPILVVSSTARGVVDEALRGRKSLKEVFKESGDIEYALFTGFLLVKEEEFSGGERKGRLILVKNRGGPELEGGESIQFSFVFNVFSGEIISDSSNKGGENGRKKGIS